MGFLNTPHIVLNTPQNTPHIVLNTPQNTPHIVLNTPQNTPHRPIVLNLTLVPLCDRKHEKVVQYWSSHFLCRFSNEQVPVAKAFIYLYARKMLKTFRN